MSLFLFQIVIEIKARSHISIGLRNVCSAEISNDLNTPTVIYLHEFFPW